MRKNLLSACFALATIPAFAQDSTLLKNYKYRTPGFRALTVNSGMSGVYTNGKSGNGQAIMRNFALQPTNVSFASFKSTDRVWQQAEISVGSQFSSTGNKAENGFSKTDRQSRNGSASVNASITQRNYRANNWFWELGGNAFAATAGSRSTDSSSIQKTNNPQLAGSVTLGFGRGRIELVQDAQMALFILNDLQQQGLLQRPADEQTALKLAQVITAINNRRVFDSRRRRIYELTTIHDFLQREGLTGSGDIRVFTTINDNWALAFNPTRASGTRWYVNVTPGASWLRVVQKSTVDQKDSEAFRNNNGYNLKPVLGFSRHVPVSLKWQRNMGASASYTRNGLRIKQTATNTPEQTVNDESSVYHADLFYEIGYYPNNRTIVTGGFNMTGTWNLLGGDNLARSITSIKPGLYLNGDYFISYNTRLSFQTGASYEHYQQKMEDGSPWFGQNFKRRDLLGNFSIGIAHVIF
ncbi:hypothetical protein [Pseudocnuella soli]|uniref:hypothetical protein n=1 Tax=Pseudocnuella soli TaxID=2502779 RepID=UPI00104E7CD3|nr:hypothetical protein [Pseudocnuella soli]